jgi:hypothetical protein
MPSLRYRRVDQARRGNVVLTLSSHASSSAASMQDFRRSGSVPSVDGLRTPSSAGSVIAFHAGRNALERGEDGGYRPGRLIEHGKPRRTCPVMVDAAEAVAMAPTSACRGMERFTPQWKVASDAKSRYHKPLRERYQDGSLHVQTHLARQQALRAPVAHFPRARSFM